MDIAAQIAARHDVFDVSVHWESAKEQLLKIVDKQRLRKTVGRFVPKNETEQYIDEIIKHVSEEDVTFHVAAPLRFNDDVILDLKTLLPLLTLVPPDGG